MSFVGGQIAWRLPIACQMVFSLVRMSSLGSSCLLTVPQVVIVLVFGLPESPRYCYRFGRHDEGLQILCDVYDRTPDNPKIIAEQDEILEAISFETEHGKYRWRNILKRDEVQTGRRVLLAYGMQFMNQVGGINLVVYFVPTVLQDNVGLTRNMSLILGGCIRECPGIGSFTVTKLCCTEIMFVVGSFFPAFFIDRVGRRRPMMWGSFGLGICMMMVAVLLSFKGTGKQHATSSASVTFFFLVSNISDGLMCLLNADISTQYMLIFGASVNCIPWCYVPEILPLHARAKGTAVGISSNWLWNFVIVMITPVIISRLQWKAYLIFMCTNFAFVPLVYFCYPETANLTLEEIDFLFNKPGMNPVTVSKDWSKQRRISGRRESFVTSNRRHSNIGAGTQAKFSEKRPSSAGLEEQVEHVSKQLKM